MKLKSLKSRLKLINYLKDKCVYNIVSARESDFNMNHIRLTTPTGEKTIIKANKTVTNWLWANYHQLGYSDIENLTAIAESGVKAYL
jgi:hypothetical protein